MAEWLLVLVIATLISEITYTVVDFDNVADCTKAMALVGKEGSIDEPKRCCGLFRKRKGKRNDRRYVLTVIGNL